MFHYSGYCGLKQTVQFNTLLDMTSVQINYNFLSNPSLTIKLQLHFLQNTVN